MIQQKNAEENQGSEKKAISAKKGGIHKEK